MKITRDWLWDRKISLEKGRAILRNPKDQNFLSLAALLLSRKNTPKEIFRYYLKPVDFLKNWAKIKKQMRRDFWNDPRIEFWQAVYEVLKKKYRGKGIDLREEKTSHPQENDFYKDVADKIKFARKAKGLTQFALAKKLGVSQQIVSRIEKGRENISLGTLKNLIDALESNLRLEIY